MDAKTLLHISTHITRTWSNITTYALATYELSVASAAVVTTVAAAALSPVSFGFAHVVERRKETRHEIARAIPFHAL